MRFSVCCVAAMATACASAQTIAIDPGHPSEVGRGTHGKRSSELHVVWEIALALKSKLVRQGYSVILTKNSENQKVFNRERAEIGNRANADLMVRLHCDASNGSGFAVFYPARKGISKGIAGPSAKVLRSSLSAARKFHDAMAAELRGKLADLGLKTDLATAIGAKQGALTGSIFSNVPVLLVEMVVLTNPKDEAFILSASGRASIVSALAAGVLKAVPRSRQ